MARSSALRRLLIEQLSERIAFHAGELEPDEALQFTPDGLAYYIDPPIDPALAQSQLDQGQVQSALTRIDEQASPIVKGTSDNGIHVMDSPVRLEAPFFHSNASFSKKIYLDFTGHVVTGTFWNNQNYTGAYNTGATINAPAFSLDNDFTTFSTAEQALIQEVWARVSEDYSPFQVDVTTEEPPLAQFTAGNQAMRVVMSTNIDATTGQQWFPAAGGVAYLNSWGFTNGSPCWVFANYMFGVPKYFADATSHEVGHTFGLNHDGRPGQEYYDAHGSGPTTWGPIMGSGYYANISQWSKGEYTSASNSEDDLAIINNKLDYVTDDHGDTSGTATQLNVGTASTLAASGLITTRTDVDALRFATQAGSITLNVDPFDYTTNKANLDAKITLLNSAGATVATVDDVNVINSTLTITVARGFYTLLVDGSGRPATFGDDGYSDYASIGKYTVGGTIQPNAAPVAVTDSAAVAPSGSILIDVLANDTDANSDALSILSIGTPAAGAAVIEAGKIRYTAGTNPGTVAIAYTVVDELGVSSSGTANVTINAAPTNITLSASTVTENTAGAPIGNLVVTDPDVGDTHTLTVDDVRFEVVGGALKLKAGNSLNFEAAATVNVNVTAKDSANNQFIKSFAISVNDLPEMNGGVVLGDGTVQRSLIQKVTVTFDGAVTIASGAFTVDKRGPGGGAVTTTATPVLNGSGQTVVTLTFGGALTRGLAGALSDGYYQLTIDGTKITRGGQQLDSNGDGQGGDTFTLGTSETDKFFALYGDTNADGLVGVAEFGEFRNAFGKTTGQSGFVDYMDYDSDGAVGVADFGQFRSRFGKAKLAFV